MWRSYIGTEDASTLINSPITSGAFYAIREVESVTNAHGGYHTMVTLKEFYPVQGRKWYRMYDINAKAWYPPTAWREETTGIKPTPADIGALSIEQANALAINNNQVRRNKYIGDVLSVDLNSPDSVVNSSGYFDQSSANIPPNVAFGVRDVYFVNQNFVIVEARCFMGDSSSQIWRITYNVNAGGWLGWDVVYDSRNKPTPSYIGALPISGGTLTGNLSMGGHILTGLSDPYGDTDAVKKAYADGKIGKSEFFHGAVNGDLNNFTAPGWYWLNLSACTNAPLSNGYGFMEVISELFSNGGVIQRFTIYDNGCSCVRGSVNGWSTWKWTNPPSDIGVEYLTAERWNGNDVYCRLVDCGAWAANKSVIISDIGRTCGVIRTCGAVGGYNLPFIFDGNISHVITSLYSVEPYETGFAIRLFGGTHTLTGQWTQIKVYYIKA